MRKIFAVLIVALAAISCGKRDREKTSNANDGGNGAFFLQNSTQPFLDVSSELRCDALKEFLIQFAKQKLSGAKVETYSCLDRSGVGYIYSAKAQISLAGKTAVLIQHIWDKTALQTEYCDLPFDAASFATCGYEPSYVDVSSGKQRKGLLHPDLSLLQDFTTSYVGLNQSKDLAYGMEEKNFAGQWVGKLDGTYRYSLASSTGTIELWLKLKAGEQGPESGTASIDDANVDKFASSKSFFGCKDKDCLLGRNYSYKFNGHHLAIQTRDGDILILTLARPQ